MSQSNKKNNISFYLFLIVLIGLSISGTYIAIKHHNVHNLPVTNNPVEEELTKEESITPYLTFKEVDASQTIDAFKKYPINPINISYENNVVAISGLKNKEIETKINEKLSILDASYNSYGYNSCHINFNVSNVFSISCKTKTLNLNLTTGEEITIEEIFNKDTDIYSILVNSIYASLCSWQGCVEKDYGSDNFPTIENNVIETLKKLKNNQYTISIANSFTTISYHEEDDYYDTTFISYGPYHNDITIYDRFLDTDIFENEVTDYCTPNSCIYKENHQESTYDNSRIEEESFLNDKTYLKWYISNNTNYDALYNDAYEFSNFNLKNISDLIKYEIITKEQLNIDTNNYIDLDIYVNIYYNSKNKFQVTYNITKNEYTKENFIQYRLGSNNINIPTINSKRIDKINMILSTDNKISYLEEDPTKLFNFESILYDYIIEKLKDKDNQEFRGYNIYDYENGEEEKDYHMLIKEAIYAIDEVNNRLHIYEHKPGIGAPNSYVNTFVSLDIFQEPTPEENGEETNNEEENNDENTNELS